MVRYSLPFLARQLKYWDRYVEQFTLIGRRVYKGGILGWKGKVKHALKYEEHPPWTDEWQMLNNPNFLAKQDMKSPNVLVEPVRPENWTIFVGDKVKILVGPDAGKVGKVFYIVRQRNWCYVKYRHCIVKEQKSPTNPNNIMLKKEEQPLSILREVALIDPTNGEGTEVEWRHTEGGERVRVSKRSGHIIDLPPSYHTLPDGINPKLYNDNTDTDTPEKTVSKLTYKHKLCSVEQDLMDCNGIIEERERALTYWY